MTSFAQMSDRVLPLNRKALEETAKAIQLHLNFANFASGALSNSRLSITAIEKLLGWAISSVDPELLIYVKIKIDNLAAKAIGMSIYVHTTNSDLTNDRLVAQLPYYKFEKGTK